MTNQSLHEQWALDLSVRIDTLRNQHLVACAERGGETATRPALTCAAEAVTHFLDEAENAIRPRRMWLNGRSPLDHWRGISVVRAYENVHAAETFLLDLLAPDQIKALIPSVLARADATLARKDPRREYVDRLKKDDPDTVCLARIKQAMRAGFQAEDQIYLRIRTFRNLVLKCTLLLVALMATMITLVATHPESMPLCFGPGNTAASAADTPPTTCPAGEHRSPSPEDIMIVAGLGLLGSAAAAAFSIRGIQGFSTPYDVPVALAVFKLPLGAFTAVTGLLLLGGGFVPGLSELDTQRQILAYALTLGYAQQLASRLVDNQARSIVDKLPIAKPTESVP